MIWKQLATRHNIYPRCCKLGIGLGKALDRARLPFYATARTETTRLESATCQTVSIRKVTLLLHRKQEDHFIHFIMYTQYHVRGKLPVGAITAMFDLLLSPGTIRHPLWPDVVKTHDKYVSTLPFYPYAITNLSSLLSQERLSLICSS